MKRDSGRDGDNAAEAMARRASELHAKYLQHHEATRPDDRVRVEILDSRTAGSCDFCSRWGPDADGVVLRHNVVQLVANAPKPGGSARTRVCLLCWEDAVQEVKAIGYRQRTPKPRLTRTTRR